MAYTIFNTDGTVLLLLADGQIDKTTTSLNLIGRNYESYGQDLNNNFVKLLANFASSSGSPPRSPLKGQLWYDTTLKRLKVYDNGFKTIGSVTIASSQPNSLQSGDLWFDSSTNQLKLYSAGTIYNVGPSFPSGIGENGWTLPSSPITDQTSVAKQVLLLKSYGSTVALAYFTATSLPFEMDLDDLDTYAPAASTSTVVSGITLTGDLSVDGKISNSYLSTTVDIDVITPSPNNDALFNFANQNTEICKLLEKLFPPNATTMTNTTTVMTGLLPNTQARVSCKYTILNGVPQTGYQVRVFRTDGAYNNSNWIPFIFTISATNILP